MVSHISHWHRRVACIVLDNTHTLSLCCICASMQLVAFASLFAASTLGVDAVSWSATPFSPAAVPLAVRSPYLSTWLPQGNGTALNEGWSQFWDTNVSGSIRLLMRSPGNCCGAPCIHSRFLEEHWVDGFGEGRRPGLRVDGEAQRDQCRASQCHAEVYECEFCVFLTGFGDNLLTG